jgi:hypothetical protein
MGEKDVVRLIIEASPSHGSPFLLENPNLLLLPALGDGFFVAPQAYLDLRKAREDLFLHVLVTRDTFYALLLMGIMVKLDGLLHPSPHDRGKEEDDCHDNKDEKEDPGQQKQTALPFDHERNSSHPSLTFLSHGIASHRSHLFALDEQYVGSKDTKYTI